MSHISWNHAQGNSLATNLNSFEFNILLVTGYSGFASGHGIAFRDAFCSGSSIRLDWCIVQNRIYVYILKVSHLVYM
jgi:hypothetical protein